jgi:hypothetical protein
MIIKKCDLCGSTSNDVESVDYLFHSEVTCQNFTFELDLKVKPQLEACQTCCKGLKNTVESQLKVMKDSSNRKSIVPDV